MIRLLLFIVVFLASPAWAETRVPSSQHEITLTFAPLVKQAAPAVVNIYAKRVVRSHSPFADDPFFGGFFGDLPGRERVQNSLGSGVILSADGIVVSNWHVVGQATDIRVVLNDRREYEAEVLLGDEQSDLAILRLRDAVDMPYLALRDSQTVEVGELVLAIGNPFGVGQTVSSGIVSGLARSGTPDGSGRGYFIQTDAPINPGNSGGALIDVRGNLIGVNTSILTRSGGSNGIGFAIPSDLVAQFVAQARAGNTSFARPWLGLRGQDITPELAESFALSRAGGVAITAMHPQSPFASAGLGVGDVLLAVDDQPVNTSAELLFQLSVRGIGATATLLYQRGDAVQSTQVLLIAPPEIPARDAIALRGDDILPGLVISRINPAVIADYNLPVFSEGIVVLEAGSIARRIGLRQGDILVEINGIAITDPDQVAEILRAAAPRVRIDVQRGNRRVALRFRI